MDNNELKRALLQAFFEEAPELLQKAQMALLDLESAMPGQAGTHLNALKRALHSMKGSASAIGRSDIRDVSHAMENLFADGGDAEITAALLDKLYAGLSFIADAIKAPAIVADSSELLAFLAVADIDDVAMLLQQSPAPAPRLQAEETDRQPSSPLSETIRVSVDKIEGMQSSLSDLVAIRLLQNDSHEKIVSIQHEITAAAKLLRQLKNDLTELRAYLPHQAGSRLNARMSDYSSQVKNIQRSVFHLAKQVGSQAGCLNLLSDEIDHGLRSIRMVPIAPFLESYRSVARDAARQLHKTVNLEYIDKGIEIDRLIMEKIKEPVLHIVRNCVSHGIELPAVRNALGKPDAGIINITADVSGDYVHIRIMDDGAGFDRRRIAEQAIRLGLLKAEDDIDDDNILDIVSRPGFSTAHQADMVSGRGVGMDVVVTQLAELGGVLELETEEGLGSCFTLRVPSSLAISQGLILRIGDQCFGVVLDAVERIVRTRMAALDSIQGKQVLFVNDDPVAVSSLATVLGYADLEPRNMHEAKPLVIFRQGSQRLALLVDDVPGEIPMIIKSMGPQFEHVKIYAGGAILSDGNVLPVLDARYIIKMVADNGNLKLPEWSGEEPLPPVVEQFAGADKSGGTIIVVDDSITTRTLERNILEAAGFKVAVATDGVEALDLLMQEDNIALLVTDMEMPRMNGIELCRNIRAGRHAELPIIMVTSVGSAEDMKKGIQAGADAYIVKGDFQQEHFLETVRRFVRR